jgi:hypothetical protein
VKALVLAMLVGGAGGLWLGQAAPKQARPDPIVDYPKPDYRKPNVRDAVEAVKKLARRDCESAFEQGRFAEALPRCQKYMELACQDMEDDDLYPPTGQILCTAPSQDPRCWVPEDPMYLKLLQAREAIEPGGPRWRCPELAIVKRTGPSPEQTRRATEGIKARIADAEVADAVVLYFRGKKEKAVTALQRVSEKAETTAARERAKELRRDVAYAYEMFEEGEGLLASGKLELALSPFYVALTLDERLVLGGEVDEGADADARLKAWRDAYPSALRRSVQRDVAAASYAKGKLYMEHKDEKRACEVWQLGFSVNKHDSDLLKALINVCVQRAHQLVEEAGDCQQLGRALDFEVPGDGTKELYEKRKGELKCP